MSLSKLFRKHISEPWFSLIMIRSKTIEGDSIKMIGQKCVKATELIG